MSGRVLPERVNRQVGISRGAEVALMGDGWDRRLDLVGGEPLGEPVGEEIGSLFESLDGDE